ncbi:xanthine dehydrogenase family Fe-S subunit [Paracoccus sp. (in: a-proteobacteria)]|uniref:xanthine dehydrogenase family Fe-S subunit n=1 Tax=Paracoccus sp. TaxID=267 RepID=UPI003A8877CC
MTDALTLTVNGETCRVAVTPRTQLAEILRDHLDLTGTHLACEQGVCGACTVMMNGHPVRSCITYAQSCGGAVVETVEGYRGDPVMQDLRDAFSRHHALQCGFCTPGMLATARDILARFDTPDEAVIRRELSGNLCRCTGYMGIVAAIHEVAGRHRPANAPRIAESPRLAAVQPFDPVEDAAPADATQGGTVAVESGETVLRRDFTLAHDASDVWALFRDPQRVVTCLPGASIDSLDGDRFEGGVEIRFGPIRARFGGQGSFANDDQTRTGHIGGEGSDRNGKSRVQGGLAYSLVPAQDGTAIRVELRYRLEGMLAQFNRPELVTGFVDQIIRQFVANCDALLSGKEPPTAGGLGFLAIVTMFLRGLFRRRS